MFNIDENEMYQLLMERKDDIHNLMKTVRSESFGEQEVVEQPKE